MENFPYDPWQKCKTISGLAADLVISAVQKEIRRGHEENAAVLAYEMLITASRMWGSRIRSLRSSSACSIR